jgi:septal ring factor EnvC (AmiA/AmiB activator)
MTVVMLAARPGSAVTPPARDQLEEAERNRAAQLQAQHDADARAQAAASQARRLAEERVAAAARLRDAEDATADAAARVAALAERERDAQASLDERSRAFIPMLPVIERLSRYPAETLLAMPLPPEQAARGVLALQGLARELESQAAALRAEQAGIESLRAQLSVELPRYAAARDAQARQARDLDQQIASVQAARSAAQDAADEAARRAAAEAARADGLRAAIARIEAAERDAEARARQEADTAARQKRDADAAEARQRAAALARPAGPDIGAARGQLVAPVAGGVTRAFGAADESGPVNGMSYQPPPAARVVSPCGGRVVFAGPFRSYGQLLIIDCGAGYHFVLAGLDRIDAGVGRSVRPGEPVGVMPGWDPRAPGNRPSLYVELRQHGQPIDPAPFLRAKG